ncbi:MAG: hypothetical protein HY652_07110 [Acidobacteria bacterium]|nr:hypothetical protein [Acidobacteriota bacterium]
MSALEFIQLAGFTAGALLHLLILGVMVRGPRWGKQEGILFLLFLSVALWHGGNMGHLLYEFSGLPGRGIFPGVFHAIAFAGMGLIPTFLVQAHLVLYFQVKQGEGKSRTIGRLRWLIWGMTVAPLFFSPFALREMITQIQLPPFIVLERYVVPFSFWFVAALVGSAWVDLELRRRATTSAERNLFGALGILLLLIASGMFYAYLYGGRFLEEHGGYVETAVMLSSILPTSLLAYHIYRYHYLQLVIKQSLVYALWATVLLSAYLFVLRRISDAVESQYGISGDFTQTLFIFGLIAASVPLRGWIDRWISRRFELYKDFMRALSETVDRIGDLPGRLDFIARAIGDFTELSQVAVVALGGPGSSHRVLSSNSEEYKKDLERMDWEQLWGNFARSGGKEKVRVELPAGGWNYVYPLRAEGGFQGALAVRSVSPPGRDQESLFSTLSIDVANLIRSFQLKSALAQAERLAAVGQMAGTIAHEIKNPLGSIKTLVQVLREEDPEQRYGTELEMVNREIDRLNRTVQQLLDFSRRQAPTEEEVRLDQVVHEMGSLFANDPSARNVRIHVEQNPEVQLRATDGRALREIVSNLVLNAVQAVPAAGTVELRCRSDGDRAVLEVEDDGPGIPPDVQAKIYEPFFTTKQRGTGLGLAIVLKNVNHLGGEIQVLSPCRGERGTLFRVRVPKG